MKKAFLLLCLLSTFGSLFSLPDEDWGYVTINPTYGSNMFWWLYGAKAAGRDSMPLVMWLQGGPGASSLFGDFVEVGPLDVNLKPRQYTWLYSANLLFVDNPIGTGFSYTSDPRGFSRSDDEIAANLVIFLQGFFRKYPNLQNNPFWVFSESYGGKMNANLGVALDKAIKQGKLNIKFAGVGLGDSWIAPVECMYSYAPFLLGTSLIDTAEAANITSFAQKAEAAWNAGNGNEATNQWGLQQQLIMDVTGDVNFYNFLLYSDATPDNQLSALMSGPIRKKLGIIPPNVSWGGQANNVFQYMQGDFMRPGVPAVEYLLNAGYQVVVYSGQLDIIVDVICTTNWLNKLNWSGINGFKNAPRKVQLINGTPSGAVKSYKNLQFWQIYNASHMVPFDNPPMAYAMFQTALSGRPILESVQKSNNHTLAKPN